MAEEKQPHSPVESQEVPQKSDPPVTPKKSSSVAIYLVILFMAAFLLLLMAYFMQERNSSAIIGNLQDSINHYQVQDELLQENKALQQQLQAVEEEREALQSQVEALEEERDQLSAQASQAQALAQLRQALYTAETLCSNQEYLPAAQILLALPEQALALLDEPGTPVAEGVPTEAQRYQSLVTLLTDQGVLAQGADGALSLAAQS